MKKEILTRDKIKIDLKNLCSHNLVRSFVFFLINVFASGFVLITRAYNYKGLIIFCIMIFFLFALASSILLKDIITFLQVNRGNYKISIDKLISKYYRGGRSSSMTMVMHIGSYRSTSPFFYGVRQADCYKWSELYRMGHEGVYNRANIGDEFYLITIGKKETILMVYNCKMFELKGE